MVYYKVGNDSNDHWPRIPTQQARNLTDVGEI
jgi:hypothetical protein